MGCAVSSHPIDTLPLPAETLRIPQGSRPTLTFSSALEAINAFAWPPDFAAAEPDSSGRVQVSLDNPTRSDNVSLSVEPRREQELPLDGLQPGEYAVEVFAGWAEFSLGFAFRVAIEPAGPRS
jgi:hypothetical protein